MSPSSSLYLGNSSSVHDYLKKLGAMLVAANSPIDWASPGRGSGIQGKPGRQAERGSGQQRPALNGKYDEPKSIPENASVAPGQRRRSLRECEVATARRSAKVNKRFESLPLEKREAILAEYLYDDPDA
jgi:hypothetical protein